MNHPNSYRIARGGLVVIGMIAVLALLTMCKRETSREDGHGRVVSDIHALITQLEDYKSRTGAYPTSEQGLRAIGSPAQDPWKSDYVYTCPSTRNRESYDLFSPGPDRKPDTPDDDWGEE